MAGLILIFALVVIMMFLVGLSGSIVQRLPISKNAQRLGRLVIITGTFPILFADEIIGKHQFEKLCETNGVQSVNFSAAPGDRVKIHDSFKNWRKVSGTILPMDETDTTIMKADSNEVLAQYKNYRADGGWVMRYSALSMGAHGPLLFDGSTCDWSATDAALRIRKIQWVKN